MGEHTANLKLYKPAQGEMGYAGEVNNTFEIIDHELTRRAIIPPSMAIGDLLVWDGTTFTRISTDPGSLAYLRANGIGTTPTWQRISLGEIDPKDDFSMRNHRITRHSYSNTTR
jgi:hypothetical protein